MEEILFFLGILGSTKYEYLTLLESSAYMLIATVNKKPTP